MKNDDYEQDDLQNDGDEQEQSASPFNLFMQQQLKGLPWWLISIVAHTIIFCLSMLMVLDHPQQQVITEAEVGIEQELKEEVKPEPPKQDVQQQDNKNINPEEPEVKDPVVKEAKVSDHVETANQDEHMTAKGNMDAHTDSPLMGKFDKSDIGIGGRAGSTFGDRFGGKENLVKDRGGSKKTENSVMAGLLWLKRHQSEDGKWSCGGFTSLCGRDTDHSGNCDGPGHSAYDVGVTGLALLCFLGAGNSTSVGEFQEQVKSGIQYLKSMQNDNGCIGSQSGHLMYNHAIATLAMAEAYALSNYNPLLKSPTEKAVAFLLEAQNPYLGWRYTPKCGDNDTSVTGWCVMALKSAKLAGIEIPESSLAGAKAFIDTVTDPSYGRAGYTKKGEIVQPPGFAYTESLTAVAMTARVFIGTERNDPNLTRGGKLLLDCLPAVGQNAKGENSLDYYYWYYGTLAMFQLGDSDLPYWTKWNESMKETLINSQERTGCKAGSWPATDRWSSAGGRIYATALNVLSLEIYYRYDKVFK